MRLSHKTQLISWKNPSDPPTGRFYVGLGSLNIPEAFMWSGGQPFWRSGPWDGQMFTDIPEMNSAYSNGFHLEKDDEGRTSLTYSFANDAIISYFALDSNGSIMHKYWNGGKQNWEVMWSSLESECNFYGKCGPFGICNLEKTPICSCLRGFEPKYIDEWRRGNWTSGCVRPELECEKNSTIRENGKADGFLKLSTVKVPDYAQWFALADSCISNCQNNCSCVAYSYVEGIGCMHWTGSLIDIKKFSNGGGADFYILVAYSELEKKRDKKSIVVAITVTIGSITVAITTYICWNRTAKRKGKEQEREVLLSRRDSINQVKFEFDQQARATAHFGSANKLGEGGFGSVYKGEMEDGQEIAVKRLSRSSRQGMEEFMNEVTVISKLQHRNLVKLLGCCVEGDEKMLVYEYMPNGSLDAFIFDPFKSEQLTWTKRKNIIEGIGRGLLYLHRDSSLKIIHRDLKASNILLDCNLNPKISDFGMARIFRGSTQDQENTKRVVGTYGYMSPEYAMKGTYSEKPDVYSFGVMLLEIISGRKSTRLYTMDQNTLSLLGLAWKLWKDEKIADFIDPSIFEPCFRAEILRYINVGLLRIEESAKDRPTVSNLQWMFGSESEDLPNPKQPAFTERETSPQDAHKIYSANKVTISIIQGR